VRIGTQDFVFCCVDPAGTAHSKTTGQLRLCANCRLPYPRELLACPSCEATEQTDDDTLTGSDRVTAHVWNLQLMIESLERALRLSRLEDAERIVQRAVAQAEEIIGAGALDAETLCGLALQAAAMSLATGDPAWSHWVLDVYGRTGRIPPVDVTERLALVAAQHRVLVRDAIDELLRRLGASPDPGDRPERSEPSTDSQTEEVEALVRLRELRRSLDDGAPVVPGQPARQVPSGA
jgi:hypothetical protein